jgi:tRNA (mo5U34)-methyltransferase
MTSSQDAILRQTRAQDIVRSCPEWYHSIELAPGVVTPGRAPLEVWNQTLRKLQLPDLHGKSVLDIGAYDGFFSFAAERLGAARVVALDHYVWSADMTAYMEEWRRSRDAGVPTPPPHLSSHWHPAELPGRRPFDGARAILESNVEPVVGDFMTMDLTGLGRFDVVLFLGILYHLEEPLRALRRVATVTAPGGALFIETEAVELPGAPDAPFCEFFPGSELNDDASNWWAPNAKALEGFARAAGFADFVLLSGAPRLSPAQQLRARVRRERLRYRAVARADAPR